MALTACLLLPFAPPHADSKTAVTEQITAQLFFTCQFGYYTSDLCKPKLLMKPVTVYENS
jgi:hypothetical protein